MIKGWAHVLKFTYIQTVKGKSFIIGTAVMILIMALMFAAANFLPKLLAEPDKTILITDESGNVVGEEKAVYDIEKVYVYDNSGLNADFATPLNHFHVACENIGADKIEETTALIKASNEAWALAEIGKTDYGYDITMSRPESTDKIKESDCYDLLHVFTSVISNANLVNLGVNAEDLSLANPQIATTVTIGGEQPESEAAEVITMVLTMGTSIILFAFIISYGQLTAQAIATEKTSRVMELLLTSIKPLAVIIGKVSAMGLVALTQIASIVAVSGGFFVIMAPFGILGEVIGTVQTNDSFISELSGELKTTFAGFGAERILLVLLVFILGFLFYSLIAGLIGASISRIEDLQTAMQPLMLISMLGFYLSYFTPMMGLGDGSGAFLVKLSYYLPISSPFALPGAIMSGEIGAGETALAIGFLIICLVLFTIFIAKVYEHIILYSGNRLKIKDMLKMAK